MTTLDEIRKAIKDEIEVALTPIGKELHRFDGKLDSVMEELKKVASTLLPERVEPVVCDHGVDNQQPEIHEEVGLSVEVAAGQLLVIAIEFERLALEATGGRYGEYRTKANPLEPSKPKKIYSKTFKQLHRDYSSGWLTTIEKENYEAFLVESCKNIKAPLRYSGGLTPLHPRVRIFR